MYNFTNKPILQKDSTNSIAENMIVDPIKGGLIFIDKLKEKELLDLLVGLAKNAKSIRSQHWKRNGILLEMAKVLRRTYEMNVHRWGLDDGISREELDFFEKRFENALSSKKSFDD